METKALKNESQQSSTRSLIKEMASIAIPVSLQSVLFSFVQLIDNLFIGGLEGSEFVKNGLNAINNVTFIIGTIVIGFISGVGIYMTQASGKKDMQSFHKFFRVKLAWTLILSFLLIGIAFLFFEPITSQWINKDNPESYEKSLQAAKDYSLYILPTLFINYLAVTISSSFKSNKKIKITVFIAFAALMVNTSLNYPLIYTLGMGVKGSSLATLIARISELALWIGYILYKKPRLIPKIYTWFNINIKQLFMVFKKASMWTLNSFLINLAFTLQIMFMSRSEPGAGGALMTAGVIAQLAYALSAGYSESVKIVTLHRMGSGEKDLKSLIGKIGRISIVFGISIGAVLAGISPIVYVLYPNDSSYIHLQTILMILVIGGVIWTNLVKDAYVASLQGGGKTKSILAIDSVYGWAITLPLTILLTQLDSIDLDIGVIYVIVALTGVFKPLIFKAYFDKVWKTLKPIIQEASEKRIKDHKQIDIEKEKYMHKPDED